MRSKLKELCEEYDSLLNAFENINRKVNQSESKQKIMTNTVQKLWYQFEDLSNIKLNESQRNSSETKRTA